VATPANNIAMIITNIAVILTIIIGILSIIFIIFKLIVELIKKYPNIKNIRIKKSKKVETPKETIIKEKIELNKTETITKVKEEPIIEHKKEITTEDNIITPKYYIKQINDIITKAEQALESNNIEDAKKYYIEAKTTYFNSNLDYEHKFKVYKKIIELKDKLNNK